MNQHLLRAESVNYSYGLTKALDNVSLSIGAGQVVSLTGRSGSGKTTLLYCLAGIVKPDNGDILYAGSSLPRLAESDRDRVRRTDFGFVFQFGELVPELSLLENVALPLRVLGHKAAAAKKAAVEIMNIVGIGDLTDRRPSQVSGGQAQRAAIARAVVHEPRVVFADEPTGSLDSDNAETVLRTLLHLVKSRGAALVLVTHDEQVASVADRRIQMANGRISDDQVNATAPVAIV